MKRHQYRGSRYMCPAVRGGDTTDVFVDGVEGLLLERSVGVRLQDVVHVGEEQVAEEVGGLARQLGRHVVDTAHQYTGTAETETHGRWVTEGCGEA